MSATIAEGISRQMEARLLEFFGSRENAEAFAHLYVIEEHPLTLSTSEQLDGTVTLQASSTWRLRCKTEEELAAEAEADDTSGRSV
ncbi:hypothetical protein [Microbacterium maritypicum]|uniref:hypothetical protein n=1 Tax=Microbacterium maritypicum TaxID=33918 RepID=UPI003D7537DF